MGLRQGCKERYNLTIEYTILNALERVTGTTLQTTKCNKHIFIDVDIRRKIRLNGDNKFQDEGLQSSLKSFPVELTLDHEFRWGHQIFSLCILQKSM